MKSTDTQQPQQQSHLAGFQPSLQRELCQSRLSTSYQLLVHVLREKASQF
jgi:hypothetical protein